MQPPARRESGAHRRPPRSAGQQVAARDPSTQGAGRRAPHQRRSRRLLVAAAALTLVLAGWFLPRADVVRHAVASLDGRTSGSGKPAADGSATPGQDRFGISLLRPTQPDGTTWTAHWDGARRSFSGVDRRDQWFDAAHGSATYTAGGGLLRITGNVPRMYVHDPARRKQWADVEITMYFKRISDRSVPYAGMTAVARTNHLETTPGSGGRCDTRGYGARLRFDGRTDFEKETAHPRNDATATKVIWPGGMPHDRWFGYKFLVFDVRGGVRLQTWLDTSGGRDGGHWRKVNDIVDNGRLFGDTACARGVNPEAALTKSRARRGSESGRPNLSVYFRSDGIGRNGLVYKWGSVREISAP